MSEIYVPVKDNIIPMYDEPFRDILNHEHTHYVFAGGRGSTKSSFIGGIAIPLLIINNPTVHAVCFRKVGNTIQNSIFAQVVWGIYQLGLEKLFKIPKTYSSGITYRPTGQRIYFMGLDDPMKVKSIKPQFGYIGITWFEELDQFSGERELRTVLQSTMRGGDIFWDFRTFNPPISRNNWANEYAEEAEKNTSCLVVRNTYLDVPKRWLGDQFLLEAEDLKQLNPRAYEHEYLGVAIGSGGDVFPNVSHLNMEEPVEVTSRTGEIIHKPLYKTFDKIYNGIDWGFAIDPFRFVRMHFDPKRLNLYIFSEYEAMRMRNKDIFDDLYINEKLVSVNELVTADSAEPKSIADFRSYGAFIRPAEKGPDSVRYGIKWLQGLCNIYIDKFRCPKTYWEFVSYEYEQDRDGNFISSYPDFNNHSIDSVRYAMEKFYKRKGN